MDPLTPTTSTLSPAISHIAETAKSLAGSLQERSTHVSKWSAEGGNEAVATKKRQQETVRWVLETPRRLQTMIEDGKKEEADAEWIEVQKLLQKWDGVAGVEELRVQCMGTMQKDYLDGKT